jgi:hypothetical protein
MEECQMSLERSLVKNCAPTLAGIKVASLYRFFVEDGQDFPAEYKRLRQQLRRQGLGLRIFKGSPASGSFLLYLYRPEALTALLQEQEISAYLTGQGYVLGGCDGRCQDCAAPLCQLAQRLWQGSEFPHEIGLFLGYPLEDVQGFVEHQGRNYTCRGMWKVYGDPQAAQRRFERYERCTQRYQQRYDAGETLEQLIRHVA